MVIEEYYDNILLVTKLEKTMTNILNHQIYQHYNNFARAQSFSSSLSLFEHHNSNQFDGDTLE